MLYSSVYSGGPVKQVLSQHSSEELATSFPGSLFSASVVGRKTLVAAGHMTTQNLGGKKICWVGGVAEYFVWLM